MGSQLAAAVHDGLEDRDPETSIRRVKEAVRRGILALDRTPKIHETEYFNHSFAPDFVLEWDDNQIPARYVYLKFADDPGYLAEEVGLVAEQHPMIIELDFVAERDERKSRKDAERLRDVARETDTLITDPNGLEELEGEQKERPILRLFSRALLQGGRGLVDQKFAASTSRDLVRGVEAAQRLEADPTRAATALLEDLISGPSQSRVQRFLQALWVGSGGSESTFPGTMPLSGALDDDALAFLIETSGVADSIDFWRRLGSRLTVDQLGRLPIAPDYFDNLQYLVDSNIDRLWARVIKVINQPRQLALGEGDRPKPWWAIRNGLLCLVADSYEALIGTLGEQLEHVNVTAPEPSIDAIIRRARDNNIRLGELVLNSQNRFISYGSDDDEDVTDDANLSTLASSLGSSATVRSAIASLNAGRHLKVHFARATATAEGPAKIPLRELVITGVPLLEDESSASHARLRDEIAEDPGNPTLF